MATNPDGTLKDLRLIEDDSFLWFECPMPGCTHTTGVGVKEGHGHSPVWSMTGELPSVTLTPSIRFIPHKDGKGELVGCAAHFFVRDGKAELCSDSGVGAGRTW